MAAVKSIGDIMGANLISIQKRLDGFERRLLSRGHEELQPEAGFSGTQTFSCRYVNPHQQAGSQREGRKRWRQRGGLSALEAEDFKPRVLPQPTVTSTSLFPSALKRSDSLSTVSSLRLGGRSFRDPTSYVTPSGSRKIGGIDMTSAGEAARGIAELLKVLGRKGAGEEEVDDPEEYPPDQWYIDNLPYPWNVAPKSKKRGGDLTKIVTQAKVTPFSGSRDCYFQWRNKILGYLHKAPGAITAKMLALTAPTRHPGPRLEEDDPG
ncbi:unnamed protein product [Sphagnum tenellum]